MTETDLVVSTAMVAETQRFAFWRDNVAEHFQLRPERVGDGPFVGEVRARHVGELVLTSISSAGQRVFRRHADIARTPQPMQSIYFLCVQEKGLGSIRQGADEIAIAGGDLFILDPLREFEIGCERPFRQLCVKLPRALIESRVSRTDLLGGTRIPCGQPLARVLVAYLQHGFDIAERLTPESATMITEHAVDLLAQALSDLRVTAPSWKDNCREALFARACRLIRLDCVDPDLCPDVIANRLGVSTRRLQRVFALRGETVMRRLFQERVQRAAKLLAAQDARNRSITEIAFACGFNDSSHFGRVFAKQAGMTPTEWRREATKRID
jgi:AraC-like DNA-binding protein